MSSMQFVEPSEGPDGVEDQPGPGRVALITCGLYLAACAVPAVRLDDGGHACTAIRMGSPIGLVALLLGWIPPFTLPWLANPLWLIGLICLFRRAYASASAFGAAASMVGLTTFPVLLFEGEFPVLGYYSWQASLIALAFGARLQR